MADREFLHLAIDLRGLGIIAIASRCRLLLGQGSEWSGRSLDLILDHQFLGRDTAFLGLLRQRKRLVALGLQLACRLLDLRGAGLGLLELPPHLFETGGRRLGRLGMCGRYRSDGFLATALLIGLVFSRWYRSGRRCLDNVVRRIVL